MLLCELFDQSGDGIMDTLRQTIMDIITPLVGQNLPFITVQQVMDELKDTNPGVVIDRSLIMDLLDPNQIKIVKRIEGDRIILQDAPRDREISKDDAMKDKKKVHNKAAKKAQDNLKDQK